MFFNLFKKNKGNEVAEPAKRNIKPANFVRNPEVYLEALIEHSLRTPKPPEPLNAKEITELVPPNNYFNKE